MTESRRGKMNGQAFVMVKHDPAVDGLLWSLSQQDGTTADMSAISMEATGPAVLRVSVQLLKGPATREFPNLGLSSDTFTRAVEPNGRITWSEKQLGEGLNFTQIIFVGNKVQILPVNPSVKDFAEKLWTGAQ